MGKKVIFYIFLFLFFVFNIAIILNIKNYIEILNVCFNKNIIPTNKLYATIYLFIGRNNIFIKAYI